MMSHGTATTIVTKREIAARIKEEVLALAQLYRHNLQVQVDVRWDTQTVQLRCTEFGL